MENEEVRGCEEGGVGWGSLGDVREAPSRGVSCPSHPSLPNPSTPAQQRERPAMQEEEEEPHHAEERKGRKGREREEERRGEERKC